MGLDINSIDYAGYKVADYERMGSYSTIHILRRWILEELEGNPKELVDRYYNFLGDSTDAWMKLKKDMFPRIVQHSDSDGGYISFKFFGLKEGSWQWQNLDELRSEIWRLNKLKEKMPERVLEVYNRLKYLVNKRGENGERSVVLFFR